MLKIKTARKDHRCTYCGRLIAKGERYWSDYSETSDTPNIKEHTNCAEAEHTGAPILPIGWDKNRNYPILK